MCLFDTKGKNLELTFKPPVELWHNLKCLKREEALHVELQVEETIRET